MSRPQTEPCSFISTTALSGISGFAAYLVILTALLFAAPAGAQMSELDDLAKTTAEQRADFLTRTMTSELTLTDEQVPKVQALNLKYAQLQQPVLESSGGALTRGRKVKSLNSEKEAALKPLLSDTQWAAYEAGRDKLKQDMQTWATQQAAAK